MVRVLFLFLTHFHVSVAHGNSNLTWRAKKLRRAYYAFASFVRREGHLYEVFLVVTKTRLI